MSNAISFNRPARIRLVDSGFLVMEKAYAFEPVATMNRVAGWLNQKYKERRMLVTFTTDAYADITMFGDVALKMLKMMGHSATVPGAIRAEDVPLALSRLSAAIDAEKSPPSLADKNADEPVISMAHRSLPLINLLTAAAKEETYVTWK